MKITMPMSLTGGKKWEVSIMSSRMSVLSFILAGAAAIAPSLCAASDPGERVGVAIGAAAGADPALAAAAGAAVPANIPASAGVPAPEPSEPSAAVPAAPPALSVALDPSRQGAKGYSLVPAPVRPGEEAPGGPSYGDRLSRLCSDYRDHLSFDCLESPSIALLNIAAENQYKSPATFWIVGALGMIVGAILFIPAVAIALVVGEAQLIHSIATGP